MSMAYLNNGAVDLPRVKSVEPGWDVIGEQGRTASGTMRADVVNIKRKWSMELQFLTQTEFANIVSYLTSLMGAATTFWLDELGGSAAADSVAVYVRITAAPRVRFGRGGVWHSDGHHMTLEIQEV